jgi:hypothetical protein
VQGEGKEKAKKERKREAMLDVGQKTLDLAKLAPRPIAPALFSHEIDRGLALILKFWHTND